MLVFIPEGFIAYTRTHAVTRTILFFARNFPTSAISLRTCTFLSRACRYAAEVLKNLRRRLSLNLASACGEKMQHNKMTKEEEILFLGKHNAITLVSLMLVLELPAYTASATRPLTCTEVTPPAVTMSASF